MKVYIGVGHGGSDPGAVGNGFRESDLNLSVGNHCAAYLKKYGVNVKISRTTDSDVWLETRIRQANNFKADLALDIHHNAGGGNGAEVYHTVSGGRGKTLARNILDEMGKIGQNSRGMKTKTNSSGKDYFGFIRQTNMPAVLVECAFVDSSDIKIVDTEAERKKMGEAIAKAVLKTLGVTVNERGQAAEVKSTAYKSAMAEPVTEKTGYSGIFPTLPKRGYFVKGDTGANVRRLQSLLNWALGYKLDIDGILGAKTEAAVIAFQLDMKIAADGLFGKDTLSKAKKLKK